MSRSPEWMRWKVRRSSTGDWWAHEPTCKYRGLLKCIILGRCVNCRTFPTALLYAEARAEMEGLRR